MSKWLLRLGIVGVCLWLIVVILNQFTRPAAKLGVIGDRLAECPDSPNCVSTQTDQPDKKMEPLPFVGNAEEAIRQIEVALQQMSGIQVVTKEQNYLHATATTPLLRYVDDVEFYVDAGVIHFRSASRIGYSDLGANRTRMERFRSIFESLD